MRLWLLLISQMAEKWVCCQPSLWSPRTAARCSGVSAKACASAAVRQRAISEIVGPSGKL